MDQKEIMLKHLQQYDRSYEYKLTMYDKLPYQRDSDKCNAGTVRLISGNVYSIQRFNIQLGDAYIYQADEFNANRTTTALSES